MKKYNIAGIITSLIFFLFFFVWGTRGKFWTVLTGFYPRFHITLFVVIIVVFLISLTMPGFVRKFFDGAVKYRYIILPAAGFIFSGLIATFVFDSIPHVIDAAHFLWTARVFIETGTFHLPASELYEYYQNTFNVEINGRFFSLFLPGFSMFLVPFELLGISHLFTPLCNGAAVFLLGKIADRQTNDPRISLFAMMFAVFSSFYLFMGASYMTHSFNLVLTLLPIYLILTYDNAKAYILSGLSGAIILFIRPQNAVFLYLAVLIFMFLKGKKIKNAVIFTIPFIMTGFLLMFHNYFYTGHPTLFAQDVYFAIREPYPLCHRLGLGRGCPNTEGDFLPVEGLTFGYAFWVAFTKITLMNFNLSGHPLIFVFVILSFSFAFRKSIEMALFFIIFFAGYYFFYLPGNLFGPRYLAETASLLFIPAGIAFFKIFDSRKRLIKPLIAALPLSVMMFLSTTIMPALITQFSDAFWDTDRAVERAIEKEGIKNSIVFVPNKYSSVFLNLMENPPYDRHGNLILLDLGEENSYAAAYYMSKQSFDGAYVVDYYSLIDVRTSVTPLYRITRDSINFEFENKRLPKTGVPDYGVNFAVSEEEYKKFYPVKQLVADVSGGSVFAMRFEELHEKSYYDFTHPVIEPGEYDIELFYVADQCGAGFSFEIDGTQKGSFSSYSNEQIRSVFRTSHYFEEGGHSFKIVPLQEKTCLMIDNFVMEKR